MREGAKFSIAELAGGTIKFVLSVYIAFGFGYGQLLAWRDMGWFSILSPATHIYAAWYSVSWPFYVNDEGVAVFSRRPFGLGVEDTGGVAAELRGGCEQMSREARAWNVQNLRLIHEADGVQVFDGRMGDRDLMFLQYKTQSACMIQLGVLKRQLANPARTGFSEVTSQIMASLSIAPNVPATPSRHLPVADLRASSEKLRVDEQYALGVSYSLAQDFLQAQSWFRKAAEQGHAEAQYTLGSCYFRGEGVPEDFVQAALWYGKAAEQGHAEAQYNRGIMYFGSS